MSSARNITGRRARPRRTGLIWSAAITLIVAVLLFTEQVALLYVVATLSVSALLIVVAFASFGEARSATEPASFDDSAGIADRNLPIDGATVSAPVPSRIKAAGRKSRRR